MGRWIDRAVQIAFIALILYLLFVSAFGSILASCCLSFACCALLFHHRRIRGEKYRMTKPQAQAILERWAYGSDVEAEVQIKALLSKRQGELVYLPKHPTATLSMGDVFGAWKGHRDANKLIVAAVCPSDGKARTFAATLQLPSVEIVDAQQLIPLVRRSTLAPPRMPRGKQALDKLKLRLSALPNRRPWHRNLLIGLGLMLLYLITGSAVYLFLSIGTLFLAGIGLRIRA